MATADWRDVYREERERPGYVLEDGRSRIRRGKEAAPASMASEWLRGHFQAALRRALESRDAKSV